ncbi:hypothetical protein FSP39_020718 [Pinctada imbricata]|uniref:Uncharacterized protein n=1 Tax=Pinctada imbricata TaxID=66713 RepID=A0AA89C549_PINIB|nr:hypothetical protein FSP39_020718 [Pinctada imbricata]
MLIVTFTLKVTHEAYTMRPCDNVFTYSFRCFHQNSRTQQYQLYEQRLTEGNVPTSLPPGLIDTSNQICCETFCCRNPNGVEVTEKASKHERTKTKKTKSKHKRKRSEYSVSPELKIKRSSASRRESRIQENLSRPISRQFHSVPSVLSHPQQHLSWMNTEGVERESESSRLLPKPGYSTSGHNTRPSEILNAHRMSNERIRQMDNNDNDAFVKRQISTSQTEHPSAAFSQHSALSEPHRSLILPPLPPFPPPPLDLRD